MLVPVGHVRDGGIDWKAEAPRFRRLVLDRLARAGVPDIEQRIVFEKMVLPNDWEVEHGVYKGAVFNLQHSLTQMLHFRPHNRYEDLDGGPIWSVAARIRAAGCR